MIYLFTGEQELINEEVKRWEQRFKTSYNELNIIKIRNFFEYDINFYNQNLLSNGFFSEKNLIIIKDFPFESKLNEEQNKLIDRFVDLLPQVGDDNILVITSSNLDKRLSSYKKIKSLGESRDFGLKSFADLQTKLSNKYEGYININTLQKAILMIGENYSKITGELDKILISKDFIEENDLKHISRKLDDNIFEIIDLILIQKKDKAILKIRDLLELTGNFYLVYNSLLSNLRVYFYIFVLLDENKTKNEITDILNLGKRSFLIGKTGTIKRSDFYNLYHNLINIDADMKSGKLFGSDIKDLSYFIEASILKSIGKTNIC